MTKPSTIAAVAVLVCTPALVSFASGGISIVSLELWYLAALVLVAGGAYLLQWLVGSYGRSKDEADDERGEPQGAP